MRDEIEHVEQTLWNPIQSMDMDDINVEAENWVSDQSMIAGCLYTYEHMIMIH